MLKHCLLALSLCCSLTPVIAQEDWSSRDYEYASRQLNDFTSRFERDLVDPVARGVRAAKPRSPKASPSATAIGATAVPARSPRMPQVMAAGYPSGQRATMQRTFEQLLSGYRRIEQQFGIEPYDVASGVAAFLVGSYMGYHNSGFPDEHFKPLVGQLRQIIVAEPGWAKASVASKQDMYEQLSILGMLMANTQMGLKQRPDAQAQAAMQAAGRDYLQQFLKVDASKVQLDAQGLSVR